MKLSKTIALLLLLAALASSPRTALFGAPDAPTLEGFDHRVFDRLLKAHVSTEGWVDYKSLRLKPLKDLDAYIASLGRANLKNLRTEKEKIAFWVNAYNAICIRTLIAHRLPKSVPKAVFFGANIFEEETYKVAGKVRSLDAIEHEILRKKFKDNRIHAALVCGASSCPRLRAEAFSGAKLEAQLAEEAKRWIGVGKSKDGKRKNYLDRKRKVFFASKIFDWFQEDFGDDEKGVLRFVAKFSSKSDREFIEKNSVSVEYLSYSWKLNSKD